LLRPGVIEKSDEQARQRGAANLASPAPPRHRAHRRI